MRSDRLLSILLLLQTRGRQTARELAERLEVSERTIQRDLDALSAAGVPVYSERGRHGGAALLPGFRTDVSGLTPAEARALFVFGGRGAAGEPGLARDLQAALRKLMAALPETSRGDAVRAQDRVVVDPRGWRRPADDVSQLATVQEAVWGDRRVRLSYRAAGRAAAREQFVDPWGVVVKAGVWYLVAAVGGEPRLYRVSRIEEAQVLDEPAQRPDRLDLEAVWRDLRQRVEEPGTGVPVELRVRAERAEMLLRLCASQLVGPVERAPEPDASGWTGLRLDFVAEGAAGGVLLGFGADVEVLSPQSLRRSLVATARQVLALYEAPGVEVGKGRRPRYAMTVLRMGVSGGSRGVADGRPLPPPLAAALVFFASGAVLVIEVAGLRLVAPYLGVTLQTSSAVIGLALAGIAVGAWLGGRLADQAGPRRLLPIVLVLAGVLTCLTLPLVRFIGPSLASRDPVSVSILAFIAVFAPSVFLSSVPPMVVKLQLRDLDRTGTIVGRLSSLGTLGAIIATFLTGFVLLAALPTTAIILGLGGLTVLIGLALGFSPGSWRRPPAMLVLGALLGLLLPPLVPTPCGVETAYHCATVVTDPARPTGRYLVMDSLFHSYVDLADPRFLLFSYIQAMASTVDVMRPPGQPLRVLHLGAGGLTMPRYVAATRPGSSSRVLEVDPGVIALDSSQLALGRVPNLRVDVEDARLGLKDEAAGGRDLVIGDAFGGLAVPWQLTTREVVSAIARILGSDGVYAVNVIDNPPNRFVHAEAATIASVFPEVAVVADPSALSGSGGGNFVILASGAPLPLQALRASLAGRGSALEVASGTRFAGFTRGAEVLTDDHAPVDQLLTPIHR